METFEKNNVFIKILKGVGISFAFTLICLTIFSVLLTYTNLSESLIQPVVISVTGISILVGSFFATRKMNKNALTIGSLVMIFISILCGAIGGIIGINIG